MMTCKSPVAIRKWKLVKIAYCREKRVWLEYSDYRIFIKILCFWYLFKYSQSTLSTLNPDNAPQRQTNRTGKIAKVLVTK
jgi:hypothetical protein